MPVLLEILGDAIQWRIESELVKRETAVEAVAGLVVDKHLVMTQIGASIGPGIHLCGLETAIWMNAVDTVTSEMNEATGQLVAVAVDQLHGDEMEIEKLTGFETGHALDLVIGTMTGAALIAAAIEVETGIVAVNHTDRAADLPLVSAHALDHVLASGPGTVRAHVRDQLLPDGDRVLDLLHEEDPGLGAVPAREERHGRDAHPLALATSTDTFPPTATAALHLGAESDPLSVMLDPLELVTLTVTFRALSRERPRRGRLKPHLNSRKNLRTVGLDGAAAAAVAAGDEGVPVESQALAGVEVEVVAGAAAGESVELFSRFE